jgi:BCD family chlorophyll transporter-like MFS transporter
MSNAVSRLVGTILGGVVRDVVARLAQDPIVGYVVVFGVEAGMLLVSLFMLRQIDVTAFQRQARTPSMIERAAIAGDA